MEVSCQCLRPLCAWERIPIPTGCGPAAGLVAFRVETVSSSRDSNSRPSSPKHSRCVDYDHPVPNMDCKIKKVKCTLVQALRLSTGRRPHRGSKSIAVIFLDHSTRSGWGVSVTPRPLFNPGKHPVPIVQEAGWAQGPVWTDAENLAPTGVQSVDRPACSQSLYRLRYPAGNMDCSVSTTRFVRKDVSLLSLHLLVQSNSIHCNLCKGNVNF